MERSPLLIACRLLAGRRHSKVDYRDFLDGADLPQGLYTLIDTTVKKTKLWRSERADIARELIAHTQDALDAGRTEQQIIESFGSPKKVAKLFRRATKRKRPLYWRTLRNIRRSIAALTVFLFITYAGMAARFFTGQPNITKNYAVMINAQNDAYSEDQKAWPIYKEIHQAWRLHISEAEKRQMEHTTEYNSTIQNADERTNAGFHSFPDIAVDHRDYQEVVQLVKEFEPQLKRLREATHRPVVGIELGFLSEDYDNPSPPSANAEENPSLIGLSLPHLGKMRQFANTLAFDALVAVREQDGQRAYENLSAMLALARQKTFDHTLITGLVAIAIANLASEMIAQVMDEGSTVLTDEHLVALSHELALTGSTLHVSADGEAMMFDDFLQRAYTDDGKGDGRITSKGLFMLLDHEQGSWVGPEKIRLNAAHYLAGPATLAIVPNRESQSALYRSVMETFRYILREGPRTIALIKHQRQIIYDSSSDSPDLLIPDLSPVTLLLPSLDRALGRSFEAQMINQAGTALLAIELYKRNTGRLPESLEQLVPNYLPDLPQDLFNPGHPIKYKITDAGYLLYSVASDGDDDNGTLIKEKRRRYHSFSDRFPPRFDDRQNLILDVAGNPELAPPTGDDGDWVLIHITHPHPPPRPPRKTEP